MGTHQTNHTFSSTDETERQSYRTPIHQENTTIGLYGSRSAEIKCVEAFFKASTETSHEEFFLCTLAFLMSSKETSATFLSWACTYLQPIREMARRLEPRRMWPAIISALSNLERLEHIMSRATRA